MSRTARALVLLVFLVPAIGTGCRELTEEEALELAREEIRREMQPEIDRRQEEIADLKREIARSKARIAELKAK